MYMSEKAVPGRKGSRDLTQGSVARTILAMAGPLVLAFSLQTMFNIVDTLFVSMLGSDHLAAISVTFPVVFIFIAVAGGLGSGATALISQSLGRKNLKEANNISMHSLIIALVLAVIVAVMGILFSPLLFQYMGVSGEILEMTISYANLIFIGMIFMFIGFISSSIIQSDGNTRITTRNMIISVVVNVILDPIFIFGFGPIPGMGLFGAGLATVIARSLGAFLNFWYVFSDRTSICISRDCFRWDPGIMKGIARVGSPASLSNSIGSIGMIQYTALVGAFGSAALAAFGVGIRLESLAFMPVMAIGFALVPIVGQNLGAGKVDRARKATRQASIIGFLIMGAFAGVWYFLPEILYAPFTTDPEVLMIGVEYLRIVAVGYLFIGFNTILGSAFRGAGRTDLDFVLTATRWISIITVSMVLVGGYGLVGIWIGFPVGNFMTSMVSIVLYKSGFWLRGWKGS